MPNPRLSDEQIADLKAEAKRLAGTHKAHPRYEEEKYLLGAQLEQFAEWVLEWLESEKFAPYKGTYVGIAINTIANELREELKAQGILKERE